MQIIPIPKEVRYLEEDCYKLKTTLSYTCKGHESLVEKWGAIWLGHHFKLEKTEEKADIVCIQNEKLRSEEYQLTIKTSGIFIHYLDEKGLYYALLTLGKFCENYPKALPSIIVKDFPDIKERALLFDVSRGRIPKLETLYQLVDTIAVLNYNQLQLSIEGPVFDYEEIRWENKTSEDLITYEEIKKLEAYCQDRCIRLVANQNVLGHMKGWLQLEAFKHLSENEQDINCSTLDVSDPRALAFSKLLIKEMARCYNANTINVNLGELDELGKGKNKEIVLEQGKEAVYMAYVQKIYDYVKGLNKNMMMWADGMDTYPDSLEKLPKDISLLAWGYEANHDFKKQAKCLKEWGGTFYLCPGTSSWLSFSGRHQCMLKNIKNALLCAKQYGANILLTDWGDGGHIQHPFVSYPAYIFAGNGMWNVEAKEDLNVEEALNKFLKDSTGTIGEIIVTLGDYYLYEGIQVPNQTITYDLMVIGYLFNKIYEHQVDIATGLLIEKALSNNQTQSFKCISEYEYGKLSKLLNTLQNQVKSIRLEEDDMVKWELINTTHWVQLGLKIKQFMKYEYKFNIRLRQQKIEDILQLVDIIKKEYVILWRYRNKESGLQDILKHLKEIEVSYLDREKLLEEGDRLKINWDYMKAYVNYIRYWAKEWTPKKHRYKKLYKKYLIKGGM